MRNLENITKDVSCKCRKIYEGDYKCMVVCMLCYKGDFLNPIYVPKSMIKADKKHLEKFMADKVKDYAFDLTAQDTERIIKLLVEALNGTDVIDNRDKQPLNEVVWSLYDDVDRHIIICQFQKIKLCKSDTGIFHPRAPGILAVTVIEKIITVTTRLKTKYFNLTKSANYSIK